MSCQKLIDNDECGKPTVHRLTGLGAFEKVEFCSEHAQLYLDYLKEKYEKTEDSYNRDTLYAKYLVVKQELEK